MRPLTNRPRSAARLLSALVLAAAICGSEPRPTIAASATPKPATRSPKPLPGAQIFDHPTVTEFSLTLSPESHEALRREPRKDAPATVMIDGTVYTNVAVRLKGAAGSFRSIDDRPALTLSFHKSVKGRRWLGLRKIHLNNSVQDDSLLCEYIASDLFRAAGVPTPRVAHACVELNRRKLGLYVLKEGWTDEFLDCFFEKTGGNLYEGGFVRDIDSGLELEQGNGAPDRADLKALAAAAREQNATQRWDRLQATLDTDRFARYLAVSMFLTDWDGYALNRNNYRIYFDPAQGNRAVFMPHGMDQMFQRADMELDPWPSALVANAFIDSPEGHALYTHHARTLFTNVFRLERMTNAIARVTEVLLPYDPDIAQRTSWLRQRVQMRHRRVARDELLKTPVLTAPGQLLTLTDWKPQHAGDARLIEEPSDTRHVLRIQASNPSTASWRTTLRLARGHYAFQAQARALALEASGNPEGQGAGLRLSGTNSRTNSLVGTTAWTPLRHTFTVTETHRDVTFVAELRNARGEVQFDAASLHVILLP